MQTIMRGHPAQVGVPASAILDTLTQIQAGGLELHSFLLQRQGKLVTEVYFDPIKADTLQRLYSITKSFVALAIGILAEEGALSLQDPVVNYFPDLIPENPHPWLMECSVRDLLCMQSCHRQTTYKRDLKKNWLQSFFITQPEKPPGTLFHYDTSATYVLTALAERQSGQELMDFLRSRFLDQIGFTKDAYILQDPFGFESTMGGSGLMATSLDLIRLGALFLAEGMWNGAQLLPKDFLKAATSWQVPTAAWAEQEEEGQGYGYQFWQVRGGGFACMGKGGQYLLCWPQHELLIVTTADTQDVPGGSVRLLGTIIDGILPALDTQDKEAEAAERELIAFTQKAKISAIEKGEAEADFSAVYTLRGSDVFHKAQWEFDGAQGFLKLEDEFGSWQLNFGIGQTITGQFPRDGGLYVGTAGWLSGRELYLRLSLLGEECASMELRATFYPEGCTMEMRNTCEMCYGQFSGLWQGEKL